MRKNFNGSDQNMKKTEEGRQMMFSCLVCEAWVLNGGSVNICKQTKDTVKSRIIGL